MKFQLLFSILMLGILSSLQAKGDVFTIYVSDAKNHALENIYIVAPQVFAGDLFTNSKGLLDIATDASETLKKDDELILTFHSNAYTLAAKQDPSITVNLRQNSLIIPTSARKKGKIHVIMEIKEQIVPLEAARLTPEVVQSVAVQIACLKEDNSAAEAYYEEKLKMDVSKHYKGGRVVYTVAAATPDGAEQLEKQIDKMKIKGIDNAFVVAIEKNEKREVYRVQVASSYQPLDLKTREALSAKLNKAKTTLIEYVSPEEKFKFKYLTTEYYQNEASAKSAANKLAKVGIKAYPVSYLIESMRD